MSKTTEISYTHHTASPWYGCSKVSSGCANCYAEQWAKKLHIGWGKGAPRVRSKSFEDNARKWNREAEPMVTRDRFGNRRPRIFPSLCDWLDPEVTVEWLAEFLRVLYETPNLDWLLLTKHPGLFSERLRSALDLDWKYGRVMTNRHEWLSGWQARGDAPPNVWLGVSVENQQTADERIPLLLQIPAKVRWVSAEPLLDGVDFQMALEDFQPLNPDLSRKPPPVQWIVVGGESGFKRRDCGVDAIVDVARQCQAAGVPVWVKQDCALKPGQQGRIPDDIWNLKQIPA